jgi:glycosyltransferase involved in cell wall biosynthesis
MAVATRLSVLITHPGRQHSHQAAIALANAGMLAGYWSGVPAVAAEAGWVPRRAWSRYDPIAIPATLARSAVWVPALRRLGDRLPRRLARRADFLACRLFDRWAAARLAGTAASAVIACEISALTTFRRARRLGMVTILDAPSIHHREQDRVQPTLDSPSLHREIADVKDAEIEAADFILTVSELARDSYIAHGAAAERVLSLTLGADAGLFAAAMTGPSPSEPLTFLFAGAAIHRKGLDLALDAFAAARATTPGARLRIVGPPGEATPLAIGRPGVEVVGALSQRGLADELAHAHCLVLPSRHDSFGMVVVEALAAGTPVLISDMVGAKDFVSEGENGWIVPMNDLGALTDRMRWCLTHPDLLVAMRPRCRAAAREATWQSYHRRLQDALLVRLSHAAEASAAHDALIQA